MLIPLVDLHVFHHLIHQNDLLRTNDSSTKKKKSRVEKIIVNGSSDTKNEEERGGDKWCSCVEAHKMVLLFGNRNKLFFNWHRRREQK